MMKTPYRRPFKWGFIHTALLLSLVVHLLILIVAGIFSPRKVTLNTDFKVIMVDSFNILTDFVSALSLSVSGGIPPRGLCGQLAEQQDNRAKIVLRSVFPYIFPFMSFTASV